MNNYIIDYKIFSIKEDNNDYTEEEYNDTDEISIEEKNKKLQCWSGYRRVKGTKAGEPGSCEKI